MGVVADRQTPCFISVYNSWDPNEFDSSMNDPGIYYSLIIHIPRFVDTLGKTVIIIKHFNSSGGGSSLEFR